MAAWPSVTEAEPRRGLPYTADGRKPEAVRVRLREAGTRPVLGTDEAKTDEGGLLDSYHAQLSRHAAGKAAAGYARAQTIHQPACLLMWFDPAACLPPYMSL